MSEYGSNVRGSNTRWADPTGTAALSLSLVGFLFPIFFIVGLVLGSIDIRNAAKVEGPRPIRAVVAVIVSGAALAAVIVAVLALIVIFNSG